MRLAARELGSAGEQSPTETATFGHPLAQNQTLMSMANSKGANAQSENIISDSGANLTIDIEQNQASERTTPAASTPRPFVQMVEQPDGDREQQ